MSGILLNASEVSVLERFQLHQARGLTLLLGAILDYAALQPHELAMLRLITGNDLLQQESLTRKLADLKRELLGPQSSMVEQLAVERVVATWLQLQYCDTAAARVAETLPGATHLLRWQEQANRRHLMSLKTLAELRRVLARTGMTGRRSRPPELHLDNDADEVATLPMTTGTTG